MVGILYGLQHTGIFCFNLYLLTFSLQKKGKKKSLLSDFCTHLMGWCNSNLTV